MTRTRATTALILLGLGTAACAGEEPLDGPIPVNAETPFQYPLELWERGVEGETVLLIHVTEVGEVDTTRVYTSSGYAALDSAAVSGAAALRFEPARRSGEPVATWAHLPVRFSRDSATFELAPAAGHP